MASSTPEGTPGKPRRAANAKPAASKSPAAKSAATPRKKTPQPPKANASTAKAAAEPMPVRGTIAEKADAGPSRPALLVVVALLGVILGSVLGLAVAGSFGSPSVNVPAGTIAILGGKALGLTDFQRSSDTTSAASISAEDVLDLARRRVFETYMDGKGVPAVTDTLYKSKLASYLGTDTVAVAAANAGLSEAGLVSSIKFDIRMNEYRKTYTGVGDAPVAPAASDASATAAYNKAVAAYTPLADAANTKWQSLLESVFSKADLRLYTLGLPKN